MFRADSWPRSRHWASWVLVWSIFLVVVSGFATEALHYLRMAPHRHVAYFIHLVFVFALLVYLPYSKFAHLLYRMTAMVFAERFGREAGQQKVAVVETANEGQSMAGSGA